MEIHSQIEAYALSVMIEQAKMIFKTGSEDRANQLVNIPFEMIETICTQHESDIYKHIKLSDEQREKSTLFMTEILKERERNALQEGAELYMNIVNPLGKFIRENLSKELELPPQLRQLTIILRGFGLDIVLGIFDELINRGLAPQDLLNSIISYQQKVAPSDNFQGIVEANITSGVISGTRDTKEARKGEAIGNIGGAVAGAKAGAIIGSFIVPGLGTVVGAAVGGSFGKLFGKEFGNLFVQERTKKPTPEVPPVDGNKNA